MFIPKANFCQSIVSNEPTLWRMEPGDLMPYSQRLSNNPYLIPRINSNLVKIYFNILPSTPKPS